MSVSKWNYEPEKCDGQPCVGDCDFCILTELEIEYEVKNERTDLQVKIRGEIDEQVLS